MIYYQQVKAQTVLRGGLTNKIYVNVWKGVQVLLYNLEIVI